MANYDNSTTPLPLTCVELSDRPNVGVKTTLYLDTGADITCIPKRDLDTFLRNRNYNYDVVRVQGFEGSHSLLIRAYYISISVEGLEPILTRVIPINDHIGLLGRDVINQYLIELDGPNKRWFIR